MMDRRTEVEIKIHGLVLDIMDIIDGGMVSKNKYQDMVGRLRNIRVMLDNKQYGCPRGIHAGACQCV